MKQNVKIHLHFLKNKKHYAFEGLIYMMSGTMSMIRNIVRSQYNMAFVFHNVGFQVTCQCWLIMENIIHVFSEKFSISVERASQYCIIPSYSLVLQKPLEMCWVALVNTRALQTTLTLSGRHLTTLVLMLRIQLQTDHQITSDGRFVFRLSFIQ